MIRHDKEAALEEDLGGYEPSDTLITTQGAPCNLTLKIMVKAATELTLKEGEALEHFSTAECPLFPLVWKSHQEGVRRMKHKICSFTPRHRMIHSFTIQEEVAAMRHL